MIFLYNDRLYLTPQEILEKEFKVDARGYRPQEVDKFLDMVIRDYTEYSNIVRKLEKFTVLKNSGQLLVFYKSITHFITIKFIRSKFNLFLFHFFFLKYFCEFYLNMFAMNVAMN